MWWVRCNDMAKRAMAASESGDLKILPEQHKDTWKTWMTGIRDWYAIYFWYLMACNLHSFSNFRCISRQLYWGHRIPAYLVTLKGQPTPDGSKADNWVVGRNKEEALAAAVAKFNVPEADITLDQDPDVLDTWFSSGLFPFSVFGWPEKTPDFSKFYPTTLLETGTGISCEFFQFF